MVGKEEEVRQQISRERLKVEMQNRKIYFGVTSLLGLFLGLEESMNSWRKIALSG